MTRDCEQTDDRARRKKILLDISSAKAAGQEVKSLADWCREAAECNLDYGTYRALVEVHGKTFDELKAQNFSVQSHAHGHHTRGIYHE